MTFDGLHDYALAKNTAIGAGGTRRDPIPTRSPQDGDELTLAQIMGQLTAASLEEF
jgi:hypothetical protein